MSGINRMDDSIKENNFLRAKWQLSVLRSGKITEDFVEDCKLFLNKMRDFFPDFSRINLDIQTEEFRRKADEAEELFEMLTQAYRVERYFYLEVYVEILERIVYMAEYVHEDVSLTDLMSSFNIH